MKAGRKIYAGIEFKDRQWIFRGRGIMEWKGSFFEEEIRCGFRVTEKRKKIWAVELELLEKFDEVCRKHGLSWYAYFGTLLGAVRHQGFIPWDDDIDVIMFRDDYEKFQLIAPEEFREPYFFQNSYTDQIIWPISKLRDSRTTAVERQYADRGAAFHQGIFIDIFPFDSVYDPSDNQTAATAEMQNLLWMGTMNPMIALEAAKQEPPSSRLREFMLDYLRKDVRQRMQILEAFNLSFWGKSKRVNSVWEEFALHTCKSVERDWFKETVYLPFEHLQIPAPAEFDRVLKECYGNYHEFVQGGSCHEGTVFEPEIPYVEYFAR